MLKCFLHLITLDLKAFKITLDVKLSGICLTLEVPDGVKSLLARIRIGRWSSVLAPGLETSTQYR